jgi:hypothetical protein
VVAEDMITSRETIELSMFSTNILFRRKDLLCHSCPFLHTLDSLV